MEYDAYGDVLWSEDGLGNRTDYSTSVSATGTVRTTTYPEDDNSVSGTRVVSTYPDGSAKLVEGTAAVPMKYTYEPIAGNKEERTVIRLRDDDNNSTWEEDEGQVTTYVMGRVTKSGSLGVDPTETFYNALGQVVRVVDPDGVETLYEYDSRGRRAKSAINMNPIDDDIDEDGTDRITSWEYYYGEDDIQPGNANDIPFMRTTTKVWATNNTDSSVVVSISESGTDGLFSATRRDSTGPNTTVTRKTGSAATITQVLPSGMKRVTETSYGRTTAVKELDSSSAQLTKVDYAYDSHGRLSSTTDARKGATTYTYNANDQVATMVAPDPDGAGSLTTRTTTYTYDDLGRATQITHPDGTTTIREYDLAGRVIEVSGTRELNIEYGYDAQGRRVSMTTHGDGGMGDQETTWTYNDEGQLSSKEDDDSEDVTYTYTDAGRLDVRTWARGVTTTYGYDAGGLLTDVDYSGTTTTNLDISYTRDGLRDEIDDSQGKRKFTYDSRRLPEFEIIDGTALDLRHTRKLDSLDRNEGWELESGTVGTSWAFNSPSSAAENTYGYESGTGRFEKLWDNDGTGASDYTYHYGLSNSHLVTQIDRPQKKVVFAYLAGADLLSSMLNYTNTYYQSAFSYGYDDSLQRKHCVYYGAGFIASHSGIWYWDYDSKGQIDNFERVLSDKWAYPYASGATRWTEDERDYDFDGIGNREEVVLTETPGGATPATVTTTDYDVNALNQYTAIGGTSRPTPHHDDDGNLIDDGTLEYEWDAENRLIEVIDGSTSNTIAEYEYDYMGRRWRKETTSSAPQGATETIFAYDGWNLIAEYDASGTPTVLRTYAWGLDLSGTLQGAGGVGGLMQVERHDLSPNEIWYYNYDGNGNVSEVVNSAEYRYAHYEYSPFGETVEKTYSWADDNPFRFSTKYFDEETGWLYYGYRYLDPENGRWSSRDPIGERGGNNLNGFVGNDGPNNWDNLGLAPGDEFTGATALADTINDARSHLRKEALAIFKSGKKKLKSHIGTAPQNAGSADLAGVADAADVDFAFWKAHDRHYKSVAGREIGGGIYCIKKGGTKYSYNVYIPTTKYSLPATVAFEDFPKIEKHKNHKSDSVSWLDFLHTHSAAEYSHTPSGATVGSGYGLSEPDYKFPHIPEDVLPEFNFRNQPIWAIDFFVDTYYDPRGSYPDMPSSRPISSPRPPNLPGTDGVIDSREEFQLR
jgi:RHS repeat-associated protein